MFNDFFPDVIFNSTMFYEKFLPQVMISCWRTTEFLYAKTIMESLFTFVYLT